MEPHKNHRHYVSRKNLPSVGDIIQWGECKPGEHYLLVLEEPKLIQEAKDFSSPLLNAIIDTHWQLLCLDIDSGTLAHNWFWDDVISDYVFISRLDP